MSKVAFGVLLLAALFQLLVSAGLLAVAFGDAFGLAQIATNGEQLVEQMSETEKRAAAQSSPPAQADLGRIRPLLVATNHAFRRLGDLLGVAGLALAISALVQLAVLVALGRRAAPSNRGI